MECAKVGEIGEYQHSTKDSVPWNHTALMRWEITVHNEHEGKLRPYSILPTTAAMEANPYRHHNR